MFETPPKAWRTRSEVFAIARNYSYFLLPNRAALHPTE